MAEQTLSLTFDGPALATGQMAVRDLAPSLLALSDLFHEANAIANPASPPVTLEIRATSTGSFDILLSLSHELDQAAHLFGGEDATALANVITYVTAGAGVLGLIKWLRNRKGVRTDDDTSGSISPSLPPPGYTRLVDENGTTLDVPSPVLDIFRSPTIRRNARRTVEPLTREGIEEMEIGPQYAERLAIFKYEVEAFMAIDVPDTPIGETETEMALAIAAPSFVEGNKWRFSDGERTFFASIEDQGFLERVEAAEEAFRKGDILRCILRVRQWQSDEGLKTEYIVVRVLEHIPAGRTLPLPFGDLGSS